MDVMKTSSSLLVLSPPVAGAGGTSG